MKDFNLTVMGATGEVGREMLKILEERNFPIGRLKLLATSKSVGRELLFKGEHLRVEALDKAAFSGSDIILGAAPSDVSQKYIGDILESGGVFIDNSSAFRMRDDVPLVVPEINPEDVFRHKGIISNPNCSTIITLVAIGGIKKKYGLRSLTASTYQAVSGAGKKGISELEDNIRAIYEGNSFEPSVFAQPIAYNLIPQIGSFLPDGCTSEEMKMQNEGRKILHLPDLKVSCTCVRVPVLRSHSISVSIDTQTYADIDDVKETVKKSPGCILYDNISEQLFPTPLISSDRDEVYVGRIRRDPVNGGITLFCCGDQIRKGAATNAIQIAETLIKARDIV